MVSNILILESKDILKKYKSKEAGNIAIERYISFLPIKASSELAGIIADLTGDGHIQGEPKWRFDYSSNSEDELQRFNSAIKNMFGISGKIRKCTTNKYDTKNLGVNNKIVAIILEGTGAPIGNKVHKKFRIPSWIINNKIFFARYMNRLFSCEGNVDIKGKTLEIKMYKSTELIQDGIAYFKEIQSALHTHFNIKTISPYLEGKIYKRANGKSTQGIRLKIKNKESVVHFYNCIGIDDKQKREKLESIIQTIK